MKTVAANTISAMPRWMVTSSAASPSITTLRPMSDCTITSTPAMTAAASRGRSRRLSRLISVQRPTIATSGPTASDAMRRWVCSIHGCSSAAGIQSLNAKQPGQSGQARPESVARTRPPTAISTNVAIAAANARVA